MKNVEDVYSLSPMQQGMLFHTLYEGEPGVYVTQTVHIFRGDLDVPAFQRAWQQVVDRHPVLRTAFLWEGLEVPLQVVRQKVRLPWQVEDWRNLDREEQDARLATFLAEDRSRGFNLSKAPLMRLALFQVDDETYQCVWTQHHILLDGWSVPLVFNEVLAYHEAFARGRDIYLARPRPYRDYIAWLQRQNMAQAEAFWRQFLRGFTARADAEHGGTGRVGAAAKPLQRPGRCSFWRDRFGTPCRLAGRRDDGRDIHQRLAGARAGAVRCRRADVDAAVAGATGRAAPVRVQPAGAGAKLERSSGRSAAV
jgi:hypothetical protein